MDHEKALQEITQDFEKALKLISEINRYLLKLRIDLYHKKIKEIDNE